MELNISKILSLLLSKLHYIILIALVVALATFGYTKYFVQEEYSSSAKFLVIMDENNSKSTEANFVKEAIHSYLEIFDTTKFFNEVAETFNSENNGRFYTASELKSMTRVDYSSNADAPSFTLKVVSENPNLCYELANAVSSHMIKKTTEYPELNKIELIDDPIKPVLPFSPNVNASAITGFITGIILSCALFVLLEIMDKKIKNLEDITNNYQLPILGVVPDTSPDSVKKHNRMSKKSKHSKEN